MDEREREREGERREAAEQHEHRNSCDIYDNKTHIAHTGVTRDAFLFIWRKKSRVRSEEGNKKAVFRSNNMS